jgi:hypothetical protein
MMKRHEIIANYQQRIREGAHTKLEGEEQAFLIKAFITDLKSLKTEASIKTRCEAEIRLLEQGYAKETVAKNKLNRYRSAIQAAVEQGKLNLTEKNSKRYKYGKKEGTDKTGEVGEAHHHFGWLYMCYDNDIYLGFNQKG